MDDDARQLPVGFIDVLSNSVVLRHVSPYVPVRSLLALRASCKTLREMLAHSDAWRHLDLTSITSATIDAAPIDVGGVSWRAERMDEALTMDDFAAGPLRGIFDRLRQGRVLQCVQTLILDGLSVPADLVREIVAEDRYSVRVLSIRDVKHLNQGKLQQVLRYAVRPTRPSGTPKLKALYCFGMKDAAFPRTQQQLGHRHPRALGVMASEGAQIGAEWSQESFTTSKFDVSSERWYRSAGRVLLKPQSDWADTLVACKDIIAFDAVLCRGPRHKIAKVDSKNFLQPSIAIVALGHGCQTCHGCPERPAVFGGSEISHIPLLEPVPLHASTVRAAQIPTTSNADSYPQLILRCEDCLRGRWCERCNRWWCEECYAEPVSRDHLRTELDQMEAPASSHPSGWAGSSEKAEVKVYAKFCVEHCLVAEMMAGAGSGGMWG